MTSVGRRRIGLVIGQLSFGGAESQLYELAKQLNRDDDVVVYCLSNRISPYGDRLRECGIEVRDFSSGGSFDLTRVRALRTALREDRIELVHAFLFIASAYTYLATRGLQGTALVTSARNCKPESNPLKRMLMRRAFRFSDAVICNSAVMRDYAVAYYRAPLERSHVVYNGVDAARFSALAGPFTDRRLSAGTVGRLEAQKNLPMFLDAAARVCAAYPGARFAVVGQGSLRSQTAEQIKAAGLDQAVSLRGTTDDVAGFLAELQQFWLTSDWEGTPNVVLEAMAAGLPVIATDAGATAELVSDGETGFVVACGDGAALAERSIRLLEQPDLAAKMGAAGAARVREHFSISRMVEATRQVYSAALDRAARGA